MKRFTFRGGTHLEEHKDTAALSTERLPEPASVSIPLSQHIGAPATPVVKVGDSVKIGQKLGEVAGRTGMPRPRKRFGHGPRHRHPPQRNGNARDERRHRERRSAHHGRQHEAHRKAAPRGNAEEIVEIVREAGISGLGGATFPTYAKIQSAMGKANLVIVNCAECEPYLTANHRLLLERGEIVISGMEIVMRALGVTEGILAVEDNKPDAIRLLEDRLKRREGLERGTNLRVCVLRTKYPQGDERQLVAALLGREIPAGKLPADVGCMILNAETAAAISRAYWRGLPLTSRIVTVTGDCVRNPKNVRAPLGASAQDLITFCGGLTKTPKKMISGGPMMGFALWDPETPVSKSMSGLLLFSEEADRPTTVHSPCIHCGRCVSHCPMRLMPNYLAAYAAAREYEKAEKLDVMSCVECGTCTYNCPAGVEIVQHIRVAKGAIRAKNAAKRGGGGTK